MSFVNQKDILEIDEMINTLFSESAGHAEQQDKSAEKSAAEYGFETHAEQASDICSCIEGVEDTFTVTKCYSNCITVGEPCGLSPFNRSTLPEWAIACPPMYVSPSYQGPVVPGPNQIPTPILRLKQLDCLLPRTVQVMADSFGFFPANSVCFDQDLSNKVACSMAPYAKVPNSKLNQYICDYQNQWIFFLGSLLGLTPLPIQDKVFRAARQAMNAAVNPGASLLALFGFANNTGVGTQNCFPVCPPGWTCRESSCTDCNPCNCGCDHCEEESVCDDDMDVPLCGSWSLNL